MSYAATLRVQYPAPRNAGVQPVMAALRCCPFFAGWSQAALAELSLVGSLRSFSTGQLVVSEGKRLDHAIVIVRGRLRAVRRADRGREVTLEVFREGTVCIEALLDPTSTMSSDLVASETTLLMFIPRENLLSQIRQNPEAAIAMARDMERRLSNAKAMAAGLALSDVEARLRDVLSRLANDEGEPVAGGILIRKSPTQQELGTMIGACRETVSRIVADLARKGLLTLQGRKLTLSPAFTGQQPAEAPAAMAVAGNA